MESMPSRTAVFPGSFNPLTVAHLAIAEQARRDHSLDAVHLVVSVVALDKPSPPGPPLSERLAIIERDLEATPWLTVHTTTHQLIADIARGYDAVIMGADKWAQVNDVSYYRSAAERDSLVSNLPEVIVADRSGSSAPDHMRLATNERFHDVSSTKARLGDRSMMAPHTSQAWYDESSDDASGDHVN